jgi:hypothetical protein
VSNTLFVNDTKPVGASLLAKTSSAIAQDWLNTGEKSER